MRYSSIFGYIGAIIGILIGLYYMSIVVMFMNPWVLLAFLGSIIFSISGLFAIKLSSKDTDLAALLFLISGLGILITMAEAGIISFILFVIASVLEFRNKNKIKINDTNQRRKLIIFQFIIVLLIPLLYFIKSWYIIHP
ncbi:MAG: hypothetical protein CVV28_08325 [Methanobacteriales archaeon HGW-Methanobacteriales-1]|jgi:hypothetical protein|nr:MAG: hypothetical protein CVV28_08325 [Methanobacteriales archaeon HGW-Methanobacteriales-1]